MKKGTYPCFFAQKTGMKVNMERIFFQGKLYDKKSADIVEKKKLLVLI